VFRCIWGVFVAPNLAAEMCKTNRTIDQIQMFWDFYNFVMFLLPALWEEYICEKNAAKPNNCSKYVGLGSARNFAFGPPIANKLTEQGVAAFGSPLYFFLTYRSLTTALNRVLFQYNLLYRFLFLGFSLKVFDVLDLCQTNLAFLGCQIGFTLH